LIVLVVTWGKVSEGGAKRIKDRKEIGVFGNSEDTLLIR